MRLSVQEREDLRKRIQKMIPHTKKADIVNHFAKEGIARRTIYNTFNKLESSQPLKDKKKTGRPSSWTAYRTRKLKRLVNNKTGISQRQLARKFSVHHSTINRRLSKMKISYRKREKTPKYSEKQQEKSQQLCSKLSNKLYRTNCSVINDDETYFTYSGDNMPGNVGYYSNDKKTCPDSVRFIGKEKFPKKVLVWIAISDHGISKPCIRSSKSEAINSEVYIDILKNYLLPFIHKHHSDLNYQFWPDLASAHYSKETIAWMNENVNFIPKEMNPPNVPQARPIENFWGCLKQKVYEKGWTAKTDQDLIRRINLKLKEIDQKFVENLMKGVKAKVKSIAENGVYSTYKKK
jgi:transposase